VLERQAAMWSYIDVFTFLAVLAAGVIPNAVPSDRPSDFVSC